MLNKSRARLMRATAQPVSRKKLHKVGKQWVAVSTGLLLFAAGVGATNMAHANAATNTSSNNNVVRMTNNNAKQQNNSASAKSSATIKPASVQSSADNGTKAATIEAMKPLGASQNNQQNQSNQKPANPNNQKGNNATANNNNDQAKAGSETARVQFINQHGVHLTSSDTTISGNNGDNVNLVSNGKAQGFNLPQGYHYDTSRKDNIAQYQFSTDPNQYFTVYVQGNKAAADTVNYINQNKQNVGSKVFDGNVGDTINFKDNVPKGYTLNNGTNDSAVFGVNPQVQNVNVLGNAVDYRTNVLVTRDGMPNTTVPVEMTGRVGDTVTSTADVLPTAGYSLDTKDSQNLDNNEMKAVLNPASATKNTVSVADPNNTQFFTWTKGKAPVIHYSANAEKINVQYIDAKSNKQIGSETLNGNTGTTVTLYDKNGVHNLSGVPEGYSYVPNAAYNTLKFGNNTQNVQVKLQGVTQNRVATIYIEALDKNSQGDWVHGNIVKKIVPVQGILGSTYSIDPAKFAPKGYKALSNPLVGTVIPDGLGLSNPTATFIYQGQGSDMRTVNNADDLKNGETGIYHGVKITALGIGHHFKFFKPTHRIWVHTDVLFTYHNWITDMRKHMHLTVPIRRIFIVWHGNKKTVRYQVRFGHHNYYVTGNSRTVRNAYYQEHDLIYSRTIKINRHTSIFRSAHFTRHNRVCHLKLGTKLHVKGIIYLGNRNHKVTRFYLGHGLYVTANKNYSHLDY